MVAITFLQLVAGFLCRRLLVYPIYKNTLTAHYLPGDTCKNPLARICNNKRITNRLEIQFPAIAENLILLI